MARQASTAAKFLTDHSCLAIIAARFSCGAPRGGAELGPGALIDSRIFSVIQSKGSYVCSFDNLSQDKSLGNAIESSDDSDPDVDGMKSPRTVSLAAKRVSECVYAHARQGRFVMTLGGDHSMGIGTLTGSARALRERFGGTSAELSVLWVDAHADINTPETSLSGRIHGMPVAFASGLAKSRGKNVFDWITETHLINLKKFVYIGLRDVDEAEENLIKENGIKAFTMDDVRRQGIQTIMDLALEYLGDRTPIHVSYDIDSLDPEWAPSTGFPVTRGLSLEEGIYISHRLHKTGNLIAMDLVEINPLIQPSKLGKTLESAASVIKSALGIDREDI
ncbi:uncharacterized protein N7496_007967 [Penicillium cataractarum]|uniref:Arginase n=1 Tax=Penicillium cataractarum TaxID=2100454 RepID=A0A9W9RXQ8_9EURO|nr:uncharacterized protein N7496_007967 [Penicillium cataractarum]KAJ5368207.1 hypothetical protein N7496_007967 [Penicillium cataractarum]